MNNDYSSETAGVANAIDAVYENKQVNKKDNVSGDFSTDTSSYPTVKAMKEQDALKVNIADIKDNLTSTDTHKPLSAKQGKELKTLIDGKASSTHDHSASEIKDANSANYNNIGSLSANATQQTINNALNTKIGEILGLEVVKIVTDKGTASKDTMNKLFIEVGANKTDVYYTIATTVQEVTNYSWKKLEDALLEDVSINWSDIQNKPTLLTQTDIDNSISDFAQQLASAINPPANS